MSQRTWKGQDAWGRGIRWSAAGMAVVAVALLMAPVSSARTYRAPYAKVTETSYMYAAGESGCATEKTSVPTFDPHSGTGIWTGRASASTCPGALQSNQTTSTSDASGAAQVEFRVHVPAGTATTTTIAVTWNFSVSGGAHLTINRPCPTPVLVNGTGTEYCMAQAVSMIIGNAWLVDLTNGTVTAAYNTPLSLGEYNTSENVTRCNPNCTSGTYAYAGGAAFSGPQSATFDISATTNSMHQYALVTYLGGTVTMTMEGYGGKATGFINMKTAGNGYDLVSVVVK